MTRWLDGPKLAEWIFATDLYATLTINQQRTVRRWRDGNHAHEDTLDRLLLDSDLNLRDVPADVYITKNPNYRNAAGGRRLYPEDFRRRIARAYLAAPTCSNGTRRRRGAIARLTRENRIGRGSARLWAMELQRGEL